MPDRRILVIGSSNVDFVMRLQSLPERGETVTDGEFLQTFGGKGANQAVASARAGGNVTFVTAIGDDQFGRAMEENFRLDGICTDHILRDPEQSSGTALVMTDVSGDNYLSVAPGANYSLTAAHLNAISDLFDGPSMLVLQMEIPPTAVIRALEIAHSKGVPTLLNYAPVREMSVPISHLIDILVVNANEAAALTHLEVETLTQAEAAAEVLYRLGPQTVIVTLGKQGAWVKTASQGSHVAAYSVTPVDTTAAGDTFCGALAVALVKSVETIEAVRFASAASALAVQRLGAQPSIPKREDIDRFLEANP